MPDNFTYNITTPQPVAVSTTNASYFPWVVQPPVAIIFVISGLGSISIFCLVCLSKTFRRTSNYLVANLCVASVYHITVAVIYNLQSGGYQLWEYGPLSCRILAMVHRLSTPVLSLTIAAISLDRSVVVRNPLEYPSRTTAIGRITCIWAISLILLVPRVAMSQYDETINGYKCRKAVLWDSPFLHTFYAFTSLIFIYILPAYILVKEYFTMKTQMSFLMLSQMEQRKRFNRRIRVMKNAMIFTLLFLLCCVPQGVTQLPYDLPPGYFLSSDFLTWLIPVRDLFRQISIFNTCLTPIILLVLSFDVRECVSSCYI